MTKPPRQWNSTLPQRSRPPKRSGRPKRKTRSKSEFARIYHSRARVQWMKRQPCVVCGALPSDGHHTENGGMGRKGDYDTIVPLCRFHHDEFHTFGGIWYRTELIGRNALRRRAEIVDDSWRDRLASRSPAPSENR